MAADLRSAERLARLHGYCRVAGHHALFVLVVLRQRVWVAALAGMVVAIAGALLVFGMPATFVGNAALLGRSCSA